MIGGAIVGGLALAAESDVRAMCDNRGVCPSSSASIADEANTLALVADILLFGGAAVAAAGIVWLIVASLDGGGDGEGGLEDNPLGLGCDGQGCVGTATVSF